MGEKRKFATLIKDGEEGSVFGARNGYVVGRICGFMEVLCGLLTGGQTKGFLKRTEDGVILYAECTAEQYDKFRELTESHYPNVCEFDYQK